jgi:hypothetical protein
MQEIRLLHRHRGLVACCLDALEIFGNPLRQNFGNLGVFELRVEPAEDALGGVDRPAAMGAADAR